MGAAAGAPLPAGRLEGRNTPWPGLLACLTAGAGACILLFIGFIGAIVAQIVASALHGP